MATAPSGSARFKFVDGAAFLLDRPPGIPTIWGRSPDRVIWAEGELFLLAGSTGVGKTTLIGQVLLGRVGLQTECLSFPIQEGVRRALYLAADRPDQAGRAIARLVDERDRPVLEERMKFHLGPLLSDLAREPDLLVAMCREADADTLFIDSMKDMAIGLSDDSVASSVVRAIQLAIQDGVQVAAMAHVGKRNASPSVASVFGSVNLVNSSGSTIYVHGSAGDRRVELTQVKPAGLPWPESLVIEHDHDTGRSRLVSGKRTADADELVELVTSKPGITAKECAPVLGRSHATAKRRLDRLYDKGLIDRRKAPGPGGTGGSRGDTYWPLGDDLLTLDDM
jgi:replicative DNA helicase